MCSGTKVEADGRPGHHFRCRGRDTAETFRFMCVRTTVCDDVLYAQDDTYNAAVGRRGMGRVSASSNLSSAQDSLTYASTVQFLPYWSYPVFTVNILNRTEPS